MDILPDVRELYRKFSVPPLVNNQLTRLAIKYPRTEALCDIMRDLSIIVQYFDDEAKKDVKFYRLSDLRGLWDMPLVHRCLDQIPVDLIFDEIDLTRQPELILVEGLRHAIILFIEPIRKRLGGEPGPSDQRSRELGSLLRDSLPLDLWHGFEELFRWIIVAGSVAAKAIGDRVMFAALLATYQPFQAMREDEHMHALRSFIWNEDIFEEPVADLMIQVEDIKLSAPMWPPPRSNLRLHVVS